MKMAIIGFGGMGGYHANLIAPRKDVQIAKVYDADPERLRLAQKQGFVPCGSADEIFKDPQVDIVLVATPNDSHFEYAKQALSCGKQVLLEKPAVLSLRDFEELTKLSERTGARLTVHQNRRFDSDYLGVCELVKNGDVGSIYRIESSVVGANGIPGGWRKQKAKGGGMILDWGVHLVDQAVRLFGKVNTVYCRCSFVYGEEADDGFYCELGMEAGVTYCVTVDTNSFVAKPRWQIFGTDGSAEILTWGSPLRIVTPKPAISPIIGVQAGNGFTKTMAPRTESAEERNVVLPAVESDVFYEKLLADGGALVPLEGVGYVLRIMEAMTRSSESGSKVKVEDKE